MQASFVEIGPRVLPLCGIPTLYPPSGLVIGFCKLRFLPNSAAALENPSPT